MAGYPAGTAGATLFPPPPPTTTKSLISASSLPSSFPPRERRTNHLRKKILKTLEQKPYPDPQFPPKTHPIPIQESVHQQGSESDNFSLSQSPGFVDGVLGTFSKKSFAKIGLYLVGAFVFQTVFAVLVFGFNDLDDKDAILDDKGEILDDKDRKNEKKPNEDSKMLVGGNWNPNPDRNRNLLEMESIKSGMVMVDEGEMDNRIAEIREMARRAREEEKMDAKRNGLVEEGSDGVDYDLVDRSVKRKEVDDRLAKLRRGLEGGYGKSGAGTRRTKDDGDDLLVFKKKYKYKGGSVESGDKPKGFSGTKDVRVGNGSVVNGVSVDDVRSGSETSVSKEESKEQEPRATKAESIAGTSKEPKYDKQTSKVKSGKSINPDTRKPRGFSKESSDTAITTKHNDINKTGGSNSKGKKGGSKKSASNLEDNKSSTQTKFWWTRLPYVMAVRMQSDVTGGDSSGFFVIRNTSGLSHTVCFEDRSDATNFSYLLESFFEGLNNFSTSIIPIPTNELEKELKLQKMKVIVVKKGQLKLYIGQPLEDVESALRTLIEQEGDNEV